MLAIGVIYEQGFTWSIGATAKSLGSSFQEPQTIADALAEHNDNGYPDEIILVDKDSVVGHWNLGKEYSGRES